MSILKTFLKIISAVFIAALCALAVIFLKPNLVINNNTFPYVIRGIQIITGIQITTDSYNIQISSPTLLSRRAHFDFKNFCLFARHVIDGCFEKFNAEVTITFKTKTPFLTITGLRAVEVVSKKLNLYISDGDDTSSVQGGIFPQNLFDLDVGAFSIHLSNFSLFLPKNKIAGKVSMEGYETVAGVVFKSDTRLSVDALTVPFSMSGILAQDKLSFKLNGKNICGLLTQMKIRGCIQKIGFSLTFYPDGTWFPQEFTLIAPTLRVYEKFPLNLQVQTRKLKPDELELQINLRTKINGLAAETQPHCCRIFLASSKATLQCNALLRAKQPISSKFLNLALTAEIQKPFQFSDKNITGKAALNIFQNDPAVALNATLQAKAENLSLKELSRDIQITESINIQIKNFQDVAQKLKSTPYAVPAPFHVMNGEMRLRSESNWKGLNISIPLNLIVNLHSSEQDFNLKAYGDFLLQEGNPLLVLNVQTQRVKIVLPSIAIGPVPPMTMDERIRSKKQNIVHSKSKFKYEIKIKTQEPILLMSNLAQTPIPVAADLSLRSSAPLKGSILIQPFAIDLFRRNANLNFFNISFIDADSRVISGRATVRYADYSVYVLLSGTFEEPQITLESDPPLEQDEIVSVLLFGKPFSDLDVDQSQSSNNFRSAMRDRALALGSLYLLASTPVESISYDPRLEAVVAKIRLAEGFSVDIGSNASGIREIGLSKQLGNSWRIHTYVSNSGGEEDQITGFLEKWLRY